MEQTATPTQAIISLVSILSDSSNGYVGLVVRIGHSHGSLSWYHLIMSDQTIKDPITPKPKIIQMVCTVCGLDWEDHSVLATDQIKVTLEICIQLLLGRVTELEKELERTFLNPGAPWARSEHLTPFDWGKMSEYYADPNST